MGRAGHSETAASYSLTLTHLSVWEFSPQWSLELA